MGEAEKAVIDRKLTALRRFLVDLEHYGRLDEEGRLREHYAIERLLQLLCESAADISLQLLKQRGQPLAASYREIFLTLAERELMPRPLALQLVSACGMRNVLTHLYDSIDLDRVIAAVAPAIELYRAFSGWVVEAVERD